jgi:hypothetical protein
MVSGTLIYLPFGGFEAWTQGNKGPNRVFPIVYDWPAICSCQCKEERNHPGLTLVPSKSTEVLFTELGRTSDTAL